MEAAVVGAGIGGLAAAIRLAAMGHSVTVFEKNTTPGGKISQLRLGNYRFDTGPSLFTLPELTRELFELCGERMEDHLPASRLATNCKYFYPDKTFFTFYHNKEKLAEELEGKGIKDGKAVFRRLTNAREVYELSAPVFIFSAFHKLSNFLTPEYKGVARKLHRLDFLRTMHGANKRDFRDDRMVRIFDRYATYNGSNPYKAPATFNMIAHLENNIGAFFPEKGMYAIVEELYKLAWRQGVRFRMGQKVDEIIVERKRVTGLKTAGKAESYDLIVSDVDITYLYQELVKSSTLWKRVRRSAPSSSALIFYWAVEKQFPQLDLHNILFSDDYKSEFRHLFRHKTIYDDPTVYIFISSKAVPDDAPEGCENWFVMVNAPSDDGQYWNGLIQETRRRIIRKINSTLGTDIEKYIAGEKRCSPLTIEQNTMSAGGALYGASSNSMFSAFLRHPNFTSGVKNLYFVGGSVHPGGGIPLCMASAKIVCNEIEPAV